MQFKTLMVIKSIVCLCFAPVLLFIPGILVNLLGASYCSGTALTAREYGASLAGNFLLAWFARNAEASFTRMAIILNLFVYDAIALVYTLIIQLSGGLNFLGWGVAFIYFFFTIGFGYLFYKEKVLKRYQVKSA